MTSTIPDEPSTRSSPTPRGTLFVADRVVTLGRGRYKAKAVLVRGTRVAWVGDDPASAPPAEQRVDLGGCTLGPGFVDAHAHLTPTGLSLLGLNLREITTSDELLRAVRTYADQHTGRVVMGHGYDPELLEDGLPDPDDLGEAAGGRAVYLSRIDGHSAMVDGATLRSAPLARAAGIATDEDGVPTGVLKRDANHVARRWAIGAMSATELAKARQAAVRHAASLGVVSVHEMGGPDLMGQPDFDAWLEGEWPIEVVPYWGGLDPAFATQRGLKQLGGDIFLDGSLGSHTAALDAPYTDHDSAGRLEFDDASLVDVFRQGVEHGLQIGVHAIGDAAIRQAVRCWQQVAGSLPDHLDGAVERSRHRIEHAEVMPPDLYRPLADLGLVVSAQPAFEHLWGGPGGLYERRLGTERRRWTNPFRPLADRGVPLAFGSDSNVTSLHPWLAVYAAQHHPEELHRLNRLEAVSASILGGRYAARQERFVGAIRAGFRADLAAWEGDPFAADDPRGARCVLTIAEGRVVHEA